MVITLVRTAFWMYQIIVIVRVMFSWVRVSPYSSPGLSTLQAFICAVTEPLLRPIRRILAPYQKRSGFDFSPLVLLLLLWVAEGIILRILMSSSIY